VLVDSVKKIDSIWIKEILVEIASIDAVVSLRSLLLEAFVNAVVVDGDVWDVMVVDDG